MTISFTENDFFVWIQASAKGRKRLSIRELFGLLESDESFLYCITRKNTFSQLDVNNGLEEMLPSHPPSPFLPLSCCGRGRPGSFTHAGRFSTHTRLYSHAAVCELRAPPEQGMGPRIFPNNQCQLGVCNRSRVTRHAWIKTSILAHDIKNLTQDNCSHFNTDQLIKPVYIRKYLKV